MGTRLHQSEGGARRSSAFGQQLAAGRICSPLGLGQSLSRGRLEAQGLPCQTKNPFRRSPTPRPTPDVNLPKDPAGAPTFD